jgi:hypothetical protein
VLPYDVALRIDIDDRYESTLLANWSYDTMALMNILMSVIRGPAHPDKSKLCINGSGRRTPVTIIVRVMIMT